MIHTNTAASSAPTMRRSMLRSSLAALALTLAVGVAAQAGPLTPPAGPVTSTNKTLAEVEPRIAINATNTPGDANSLFKVTQPGSYYLTGNITGVAGKHGIGIASDGVTIDLNGFDLIGAPGSFSGVATVVSGLSNIVIRNGSVREWAMSGVDLYSASTNAGRVEGVHATGNGSRGIAVGQSFVVTECSATANSSAGFYCGNNLSASKCVARSNGGDGIYATVGAVIDNCSVQSNALSGIHCTTGATITKCGSGFNAENGIFVSSKSVVAGNNCMFNGSGGDGAGIYAIGDDNRIEDNNCAGADRGIDVDASGNIILRNTCASNTVNWSIVASNVFGPIIDRTNPASAAVNGNAATSSLGSTDPNANYTY